MFENMFDKEYYLDYYYMMHLIFLRSRQNHDSLILYFLMVHIKIQDFVSKHDKLGYLCDQQCIQVDFSIKSQDYLFLNFFMENYIDIDKLLLD